LFLRQSLLIANGRVDLRSARPQSCFWQ
jgi:hypothetical protein